MTPCPCLCQALPSASFPDATVPLPLCPAAEQAEALAMPCHILQEELQEPTTQVMRPPQPKAGALPRRQLCVNHNDEETPHTGTFLLYPKTGCVCVCGVLEPETTGF